MEVAKYYELRERFYSKYPTFFSTFSEPKLEYALYGSKVFEKSRIDEINYASEQLWKVLKKVKNYVLSLSDSQLVQLGYPVDLIPFIRIDYLSNETALSRFDFIVQDSQIKAIEINNVTPFLVVESFFMNNEIVKNENLENKNTSVQPLVSANENAKNEIIQSYSQAIADCKDYLKNENPKINIASQGLYEDWEEYEQVKYIFDIIFETGNSVEHIELKDLQIEFGEGVFTPNGDKIDILIIPAYPYEFLINDTDSEGNKIGIELLKLVRDKKLALINPPSANILQSKVTFSLMWKMYLDGKLTKEEEDAVSKYVAPTHNYPLPFQSSGESYVEKSSISREGSSVKIHKGNEVVESQTDLYSDYCSVYQKYYELPQEQVIVDGEYKDKHYIVGSFICNNRAVALSCRLGNEITEWDSHWMAVSYMKEGEV